MLSNAYFIAKIRFDAAENEPAKNLQNFRKMHFRKMHFRGAGDGRELREAEPWGRRGHRDGAGDGRASAARPLRASSTGAVAMCER